MKNGWDVRELAAVSAINYGYTESASAEPVGPRFLRITDIQNDQVDWENVPYCRIDSRDLPKYRLASGDIVFARTGATTGKSFLVDDPPDAVFASYLIRLRLLDKKLLPEFVSLFFQTVGYWKSIKEGSAGSAQGGFNASKLGALSIPTPPLPEQRRIVSILDEAFDGLVTAKANEKKNLHNARALFESYLQSVFTQKDEGWIERRLGDVFDIGSSKRIRETEWTSSGVPFYGGKEIVKLAQFGSAVSNAHISEEKYDEYASKYDMPRKGDILITARGTIGVGYVVTEGDKFYYKDGNIISFREKTPTNPFFVLYAFRSKPLIEQFADLTGATVTHLPIERAKSLILKMPSFATQNFVVEHLGNIENETQRLESIYQQKLTALDALKKSLLHQAFSGAL